MSSSVYNASATTTSPEMDYDSSDIPFHEAIQEFSCGSKISAYVVPQGIF